MNLRKQSVLTDNNQTNAIIGDSCDTLQKAGFSEADINLFVENIIGVLDDYAACLGEGTKIQYLIRKLFGKVELRILIPGKSFDPFTDGNNARKRFFEKVYSLNLNSGASTISYRYAMNCNIISISIPLSEKRKKIIKDPIVWSIILGIVCGFLCRLLPQPVSNFIIGEIASPVQSIILNLISGVMGPVVFFSLVSSIIALEGINDLTGLGFKIIWRFVKITLFLAIVTILVSGLVFRNYGSGSTGFSLSVVLSMIFDVVPTNLIDPFLKNNTAQLVILGLLAGAGLLLLGDSTLELKKIIEQINKWVMSVMRIILILAPAIPFFSLMITIGKGKEKDLLSGWKFIVVSYLAFSVCIAAKAVKASFKTGVHIPELWRKIKPVAKVSFTTGSTTAAIKSMYEVSDELRIKPSFSSFWIPMGGAMLSPKTAVNVVIAAFMASQLEAMPVSYGFLLVLIITTLELSIASPGIPAACTVVLRSLGLPIDYVGLFTTYRLLTDNYGAACSISYSVLEEFELSHKLGEIDSDKD